MNSSYNTLYLIDISSFIFRAFYAVRELTAPDGTPVNAVYGVASMLGRLMDEVSPEYLRFQRTFFSKNALSRI